ncbi:tyrosine-type recombinase/integrase [Chromobacterium sp. IIBBL 290-4]|uniref:tyrosine-type recombinase/integrase n=1 Tax=Chromobacterium sp. IIBBL 290-4 TaxID=2953890 RepID=UPI0020B858AF|nr:tyrosine-type recombinase/integrase [Chromobacterium sp. IIBBL 290-4]UTH72514.1 tyrosine-type recombinase/integrase [Chromobacterium sp. IIBBL 290-4]
MPLTDKECRNAKPTGADYQLSDGGGLSLVVRAKGTKLWRYEGRLEGRKIKFSIGNYPEYGLAEARKLLEAVRVLIQKGRHPEEALEYADAKRMILEGRALAEVDEANEQKAKAVTAEEEAAARAQRMTFAEAASRYKAEWVDHNWKHPDKGFSPARLHLLPKLGDMALEDIDVPAIRDLLLDVRERRGVQAALHAHGWASRILDYAAEHLWCKHNPAKLIKPARIGTKGKRTRWLKAHEIRRYLVGLYQADCYRGYKLALHLLLMLALRKNELVSANWSEFDLEAGEWLIPAGRMKARREHRVFLPKQAIEMLQELKRLGGGSEWVMPMPSNKLRPMHGNNLNGAHAAAITAAAIEDCTIHDHRHTASTHLREMGHMPEVVEAALSHAIPGIAGVYAHAQYKEQRLAMLQSWADFLDLIMNEKTVLQATFRKIA